MAYPGKRNAYFQVINYETLNPSVFASLPLTTKGDILGYSTEPTRIPVGADDTILTADSTLPAGAGFKALTLPPITQFDLGWTWCAAYRSSALAIPNATNTNIGWTTTATGSASAVTLPETGVYFFTGRVTWSPNSSGTRYLILYSNTNGALDQAENQPVNNTNNFAQTLTCIRTLTAGDTVALRVRQTSGGSLDVIATSADGAPSFFGYIYLGPAT
jgi:hypothetical protein